MGAHIVSAVGATVYEEELYAKPSLPRWRPAPEFSGASDELELPVLLRAFSPEFGGKPITQGVLKRSRDIRRLKALISKIATHGLSWELRQTSRISSDTAVSALAFLESLSSNKKLPRISPDGDGNLILYWDGAHPLLVTIDGWRAHAAFDATTAQATYLENIALNGLVIPRSIYSAIPSL